MGKKAEALHKSLTGQGLASRATGSSLVHKVAGRQANQEVPVRGMDFGRPSKGWPVGKSCLAAIWEVGCVPAVARQSISFSSRMPIGCLSSCRRHRRMAASPFAFFRGAAAPGRRPVTLPPRGFWYRRAAMPISRTSAGTALRVAPRVRLNDFDETAPGGREWDVGAW